MKGVAQGKVSKGSFTTCPRCADGFPTLQKALIHIRKDHPGSWDNAFATEWAARGCKYARAVATLTAGAGGTHARLCSRQWSRP